MVEKKNKRKNKDKRKPVTVSLRADLLNKYSEYCKEQGMVLSRRIEILMEEDLKKQKP